MGTLDDLTILRYAHAFDAGGGGVEQHLADLNAVLSRRNRLTTIQMEWTRNPGATAETETVLGASRLRRVPLLVGDDVVNGDAHGGPGAGSAPAARWLKETFRDRVIFAPPVEKFVTRQVTRWRRVPRHRGEPENVGRRASELIRRHGVDLVVLHASGGADAAEIIAAAGDAGVPVALVHHFSNDRLRGVSLRQQLAAVDGVAGASLVDVPGFIRGRFRNLSDAVDTDLYSPAAARPLGRTFSAPVLFAPGRITPSKGQADVIRVAARLRDRGLAVRVVFAGRVDSPAFDAELRRQVERAGLTGTVDFLGPIPLETLRDWYAAAHVVLFPTRHHEGMPRMLVDSQAMGACPVVYDIGGTPEGVRSGETGFLIPLGDIAAFADAVESLLRDPALRERMSAAGQRFARERFSLDAFAARHECFYADVLAGRAGGRSPRRGMVGELVPG